MVTKKIILPPPMNPQEKPITVAVLSGKLDALFVNVKEMVTSTVKGTENVLRKEIERLDTKIDGVHLELKETEARLSAKIDKIGEHLDDHENRIVVLEKNQTAHP